MENILIKGVEIKKCEHGKRKTYCVDCKGGAICEHNTVKYTCKECKGSALCIHYKTKSLCKICKGNSICEHNKNKRNCIECKGGNICEHLKVKSYCVDCKGTYLCIHNKRKAYCKECGGSQICEHNKRKSICKDCNGSQLCIHQLCKSECRECLGNSICLHKKIKSKCVDCRGSSICEHNKYKRECKDCKGSGICQHNKNKNICVDCKGSKICVHGLRKYRCYICDGRELCKFCKNVNVNTKKYDGFCIRCFIHIFPDKPISKNYKTKEKTVIDYIINEYPNLSWLNDKKIIDGCSKRRPDLLLDLGYQIIIVEVDENQHEKYDCSCENKRIMELSNDVGNKPIVFIRFNPDNYLDESGKNIKSCWGVTKNSGILIVKKKDEWINRLKVLNEQIEYWINPNNKTEKTIEIVELFYNINN
jgi:hypothetical protein